MRWLVSVDSLQSLFTANLHASWLSVCWMKITVKFPWQRHETPREQFYSRLWQEQHDPLCMEPRRERLVCSIIGCDTAWRRLHSANNLFCDAFVQVNWVVPSSHCGVCTVGFLTERHHLSNKDLCRLLFFISLSIMHFFTVKMCLFYSTRQHWFPFCSLQCEISIMPAFEARLSCGNHNKSINFTLLLHCDAVYWESYNQSLCADPPRQEKVGGFESFVVNKKNFERHSKTVFS